MSRRIVAGVSLDDPVGEVSAGPALRVLVVGRRPADARPSPCLATLLGVTQQQLDRAVAEVAALAGEAGGLWPVLERLGLDSAGVVEETTRRLFPELCGDDEESRHALGIVAASMAVGVLAGVQVERGRGVQEAIE